MVGMHCLAHRVRLKGSPNAAGVTARWQQEVCRLRRVMGCTHSTFDPASRFRFIQYIPHLERAGWEVSLRPNQPPRPWSSSPRNPVIRAAHHAAGSLIRRIHRLQDIRDAAWCDLVFVNRDLLGGQVWYEKRLLRQNPRVIFDFDDAIFLGHKAPHIEWICRHAAWVTAGNEYLAQFARRVTEKVTILPTVVEVEKYAMKEHRQDRKPITVGWCGSDQSIRETLIPHVQMCARLQARLGFEFLIISKPRPLIPDCGLKWSYVEWSEEIEQRMARYIDIGVMPLIDNEYQKGKCGLKILQYMAAGIPTVASPVGVNSRIIQQGERGFLATAETEWSDAIGALMSDHTLRRQFAQAGRAYCEQHYSLTVWLPVLLQLFEKVSSRG